MSAHETPGRSDEWYTPAYIFAALGCRFDLDVACPAHRAPAVPADKFISHGSLGAVWSGFVWMNPPFGGRNGIAPWLDRFMAHGHGIALTPDRTSAPWWQTAARQADAILFMAGKVRFIPGPGAVASSPAQGTTLMAKGALGAQALERAAKAGLGTMMVHR